MAESRILSLFRNHQVKSEPEFRDAADYEAFRRRYVERVAPLMDEHARRMRKSEERMRWRRV